MSKYLVSRGHNVTVFSFTGSHYLLLKKGSEIKKEEVHEGVKFLWFRSLLQSDNPFARIINWQWFNLQLKKWMNTYKGKHPNSVVFSIPALHHVRLMPLSKRLFPTAKHIFEIQDIWPLSVQDLGGYSTFNPIIKRLKDAENVAFKMAEETIAVQPGIHNYVNDDYPSYNLNKVHFIPHAYMKENISSGAITFDIGYAGTISRANDLETLIKALLLLKITKSYEPKVLIVGTGSSLKRVRKLALNLKNMTFMGWKDRKETLPLLQKCKICYDGLLDLPMYKYGFSRLKWVDYMLLGKPILASYSGEEIDVPINEIGWKVGGENHQQLAAEIERILYYVKAEIIEKKGRKALEFVQSKRAIESIGLEYERILLNET